MPFISSIRGTFGVQNKQFQTPQYITVSPSVGGQGDFRIIDQLPISLTIPGEYTISLPFGGSFRANVWGAGGGGSQPGGWGGQSVGGSGGYATGVINALPKTSFKLIVGEGGSGNTARYTFGGGRSSQPNGGESDNRYSACGGGFSGIFSNSDAVHDSAPTSGNLYRTSSVQARSILIAGGGGGGGNISGGSNNTHKGGHGGGSSGTGGESNGSVQSTTAGTQSGTGATNFGDQWGGRINPAFMGGGSGSGQGYGAGAGGR